MIKDVEMKESSTAKNKDESKEEPKAEVSKDEREKLILEGKTWSITTIKSSLNDEYFLFIIHSLSSFFK